MATEMLREKPATPSAGDRRPLLSITTPAYNEAKNLPIFYDRLCATMATIDADWEWVVVDDHSSDDTFRVVSELARRDQRVRGLRFSRNFGAHTAIACGLGIVQGDCVAVLAADLQDPPETIAELLEHWSNGAPVVWAVRHERKGESVATKGLARIFYWLMRHVVGMKEMPATGADFFLLDRKVVDAFSQFSEANVSILALITWMGFRQVSITYDKEARIHGRSGWNLKKKLKLVVDSVTSFSYVPIRFMSYFGFLVAVVGFFFAGVVTFNALHGAPVQGWPSMMVVVLVLGGVQMLMMGVLGEYLWRALDEARRRPRYIIEAATARIDLDDGGQPSSNEDRRPPMRLKARDRAVGTPIA
jgi:dolichol-phosphate mannosyltransferase